ncbi:MAG: hypothetical protein H0X33_09995 [Taibaiella sp.]|nr:hypothetical protein [Taibaiella sp.]
MSGKKEVVRKVGRDSGNGQFVPIKETVKRPKTTEVEKIHYPAPAKKSSK